MSNEISLNFSAMFSLILNVAWKISLAICFAVTLPIAPMVGGIFGFFIMLVPVLILSFLFTPIAQYMDKNKWGWVP